MGILGAEMRYLGALCDRIVVKVSFQHFIFFRRCVCHVKESFKIVSDESQVKLFPCKIKKNVKKSIISYL